VSVRLDTRTRERRRRRGRALRWAARVAAGLILLGVGIAIGEALHDNPKPGATVTQTTTLHKP
jgi:hypothetical protein